MLLADTVVCKEAGAPPDVATTLAHRDWKEVAYFLKVDDSKAAMSGQASVPSFISHASLKWARL